MTYILKNKSKSNFTIIDNNFLNDSNLSLAAKGLGSFLLAKPSNWIINPTQISKEAGIGRDALKKIMNDLIINGYMYKSRHVIFAKKGEQSVFYHISDCKDKLYNEVILKEIEIQSSQLPLPAIENPLTELPTTENPIYTNDIIYKEDFNKENKKTTNSNLHDYLDTYLDISTKENLLKIRPNITSDEFVSLYNRCLEEEKGGYTRSANACLILALKNRWNFRTKEKNPASVDEKIHKALKSKVSYYFALHKEAGVNLEDVVELFRKECSRYSPDIVSTYEKLLVAPH
ncbi:hypothetical protein H5J22_05790 [Cetobacterium sp. 8H]|uniref:hypothetical protein n=1 Tax=Cetobacterium sp. 8H TaxID=2759681 RepID=UPI00163C646E|nr:hypothetical protein [Cetobacterium sp. 8H]MBC2850949.1 hypothetical protein [Cetobacterium sp. 8H]